MHIIQMGMFLTNFLNCNLAEAYVMQDLMFIGALLNLFKYFRCCFVELQFDPLLTIRSGGSFTVSHNDVCFFPYGHFDKLDTRVWVGLLLNN